LNVKHYLNHNGGLIKLIVDKLAAKKLDSDEEKEVVNNTGLLLASGLVAGEALVGIILAGFVGAGINLKEVFGLPGDFGGYWTLGVVVFVILGYVLIKYPLKELKEYQQNTIKTKKMN